MIIIIINIINIIDNVNISIIINYKNYNYNNNNNNNNYNKNVNNHIVTTMLLWFSGKFSSVGACGSWSALLTNFAELNPKKNIFFGLSVF